MFKYTTTLLTALLCYVLTYAVEEPVRVAKLEGSKGELKAAAIVKITDQGFFDDLQRNPKKFVATNIKNVISFQLDENSPLFLKTPFKATLTYRLYYKFKNTPSRLDSLAQDQVMELVYDTTSNKTFNARKTVEFNDAVEVTVKVVSIQTNASGWNPIQALVLRNDIIVNRTYTFDCETNKVPAINFIAPTQNNADELKVFWLQSEGVDEYDLEWAYVDETAYSSNLYGTPGSVVFAKNIFKNRATRVTLTNKADNYLIPLLYESKGYVFMRVRGVQLTPDGKRFETNWSTHNQFYFLPGHQPTLNWQASTSFAEEGKKKSVVQYFDGSLLNRQTVTKDNSSNDPLKRTTVVAETRYDYQGRPVIQLLPAPTLNTIIAHTPNFNNFINTNQPYYKDVYDKLKPGQTVCNFSTPALDVARSGAALYYSPSNPVKTDGFNQFIPDSKGYPYTETQYNSDNTGRIKAQGGVGPDHQLGSGHETKYFYSNPDQSELDALFGTEVGNASHYFKNMVKDANGQYSVSYVDMHGRTIATALAGELPSGIKLDYLPSKNAVYNSNQTITRVLTSPDNNIINGLVIESSKGLTVTRAGNHQFTYSLLPENVNINDCNNVNVCYTCSYNLEITISDECGNMQFGGRPYIYTDVVGGIKTDCSSLNTLFEKKFDKVLNEGSYTVSKKLTIRDEAIRKYEQSFSSSNVCKTFDDFVAEQANVFMQTTNNCATPCDNCKAQLGTSQANFVAGFIAENALNANNANDVKIANDAYTKLQAQCQELCGLAKAPNKLDMIYQAMIKDMTPPYGQYANFYENQNGGIYGTYNIFGATAAGNTAPKYTTISYGTGVTITVMRNGVLSQPLSPAALTPKEFIDNFQPAWADILLKALHPERARYEKHRAAAVANDEAAVGTASYDWDVKFMSTETYNEALQNGFLNPTNNTSFITKYATRFPGVAANADPFFKLQPAATNLLHAYMNNVAQSGGSISIWSAASVLGICNNPKDETCVNAHKSNPFPAANNCTVSKDYAWRSFRALYMAKKNELIANKINSSIPVTINAPYRSHFENSQSAVTGATGISDFSTTAQVDTKLQEFYSGNSQGIYAGSKNPQAYTAAGTTTAANNTCWQYRELWWSRLAPCVLEKLAPYKTALLDQLELVCRKGTDKDHIMGASSIAPDNTNTYKDFDEVIKYFVGLYNAANPNTPLDQLDCNGSLLNFPAPYSQPQVVDNKVIITKPEACECERINRLYIAYTTEARDADFAAYMKRTLQTTISNQDLQTLLNLCNNNDPNSCKFIEPAIKLPPALQCKMENICAPCSAVAQAYADYKLRYPEYLPAREEATDEQQKINSVFAYFMNQRFGFNKSVADYLSFLQDCGFSDGAVACQDYGKLLKNYKTEISPYRLRIAAQSNELVPPVYITDPNVIVGEGALRWPKAIRDTTGRNWVYFQQISGTNNFCLENGFSIEFSFKFQKKVLLPVDDVFFLTSTNVGIVIFKQEGANPGLFLRNINTRKDGASQPSDIYNGLTLMHADPDIIYKEWSTVKVKVTRAAIEVYFNGKLIRSAQRMDAPLMNGVAFTLAFLDYQAAVDWFKIYNANNKVVCFENYNDAASRGQVDPSFICPQPSISCEQSFANYFNQQKGTSLSFSEIDAIYKKCGQTLDVCKVVQDKNTLNQLIDSFYVNARPGRVVHNFGTQEEENFTDLKSLVKNGVLMLPDSVRSRPGQWYNNYQLDFNRFCTNNGYTVEMRFKFIQDPLGGDVFYLGYRSLQALFYRDATGLHITKIELYNYNYSGAPGQSFDVDILVDTKPDATVNWMTIKAVVKPNKYELYYNGTKVYEFNRNPSIPIADQQNFGLGLRGRQGAVDWVRVGDVNDSTMYFEDFNDVNRPAAVDPAFNCSGNNNCQAAFVNYFNQQYGGNYTYAQIDEVYANAGISLDICYARPPVTDVLPASTFFKTYSNEGFNEMPVDMQPTSDGGYIIAGNTLKKSNSKYLGTLIKTDVAGNISWAKQFGDTSTTATNKYFTNLTTVLPAPDGGYMVAGVTDNFIGAEGNGKPHTKPLIIKTDANGNTQWSTVVSAAVNYGGAFYGNISNAVSMVRTTEGNYAINLGAVAGGNGMVTAVLNSQGVVQWAKSYFPAIPPSSFSFSPEISHNYLFEQGDSLVVFVTAEPGVSGKKASLVITKIHKQNGGVAPARYFILENAVSTRGIRCARLKNGYLISALYSSVTSEFTQQGTALLELDMNLQPKKVYRKASPPGVSLSASLNVGGLEGNLLLAQSDNTGRIYFSHEYNDNFNWGRVYKAPVTAPYL